MTIEKCKDFVKDGYGTWDDTSKPTTFANMYDFMKNQNNVVMNLARGIWQPSTSYVVGAIIRSPNLPAGCVATCTTAGTSGTTEPKWIALGMTVTDGSCKWKVNSEGTGGTSGTGGTTSTGDPLTDSEISAALAAAQAAASSASTSAENASTSASNAANSEAAAKTAQTAAEKARDDAKIDVTNLQNSINSKQNKLTFDTTPTANSSNPVTSDGIKKAIDAKTVDLSNYYTKTQVDSAIANAGVSGGTVDLSNYVEKTDYQEAITSLQYSINSKQDKLTFDTTPTAGSTNPVTSAGIKAAIDAKRVDLSNYYTKNQVDSAIASASGGADLSNYYTKAQVDTAIADAISAITDGDNKSY